MVSKQKCLTTESDCAGTSMERPGQLHLKMQQTAVDGVSLADGKMTSEQGVAFSFQADIGMNSETSS